MHVTLNTKLLNSCTHAQKIQFMHAYTKNYTHHNFIGKFNLKTLKGKKRKIFCNKFVFCIINICAKTSS
jgi:hypothetical protein